MKTDEILMLVKAGFSKDDIIRLSKGSSSSSSASATQETAAPTPSEAAPAPEKAEQKTEEVKKEEPDISKIIEQKIGEAFKPFETLYNNIAIKANMPTIGNIQPKGIDDIIDDFFTK